MLWNLQFIVLTLMERTVENTLLRLPGFEHALIKQEDLPNLVEAQCPICMVDFEVGAIFSRTPCQHIYHYHCLMPAFIDCSHSSSSSQLSHLQNSVCREPHQQNAVERSSHRDCQPSLRPREKSLDESKVSISLTRMNQALAGNGGMMDEEHRPRPQDGPVQPNSMWS